ncbi:saccharopine dehydrogenase family protein [Thermocladium modestius]|nr:saccharopine dehydrogenase C-terminal domain-containing protein [Thermocladium modestius]
MGRAVVLGLGPMGRAAAYYLSKYTENEVVGFDISASEVERARSLGINASQADALAGIDSIVKDADVVIGALPQSMADEAVAAVHSVGVPMVDMIFMWKYDEAKAASLRNGAIIVPACGWAPGLTNLLAAAAVSELDDVNQLEIHVGGNPINPSPPLYYSILFSLDSTIDEYVRPATVVRDGRPTTVDPLDEVKAFNTSMIKGDFEEFYTDGLSTLIGTLKVRNMAELTIRWRGHLEAMKLLRRLGLLDDRKLASQVLGKALGRDERDFSITVVEARGSTDGEEAIIRYEGIDYASDQFTSMSRLTGFFAAITANLIIDDYIRGSGLTPIETVYSGDLFGIVMDDLRKVGIKFWRVERRIVD